MTHGTSHGNRPSGGCGMDAVTGGLMPMRGAGAAGGGGRACVLFRATVPSAPAAWPTLTCSIVPGVSGRVAVTSAPSPPAPWRPLLPPSAPYKVNPAEVTPAGTVQDWAVPVSVNTQVTWLPLVVQPVVAALASPAGITAAARASPAAAGAASARRRAGRDNTAGRLIGWSFLAGTWCRCR